MGSRAAAAPARGVLLLVLALALVQSGATQVLQAAWARVAGQPLADAVAAWASSGYDTEFSVAPRAIVELGQAIFPLVPPPSNGTFTIRSPDSSAGSSVVDAAMRAALVPPLRNRASIVMANVSLVNLCFTGVDVVGLPVITPLLGGLFSLSPITKTLKLQNATLIMQRTSLSMVVYMSIVIEMLEKWPFLAARFTRQLGGQSGVANDSLVTNVTPYSFEIDSAVLPVLDGKVTFRSTDDPSDPLLAFMRAQGLLMRPRWCGNQTLVPSSVADNTIDPWWGPVRMLPDEEDLAAALLNATQLAEEHLLQGKPIPAVMVFARAAALPGRTMRLSAPLLVLGPNVPSSRAAGVHTLDLGGRTAPLFNVSGSGQLLLHKLVLVLPALPLPPWSASTPGSPRPVPTLPVTALPLTALASSSGGNNSTRFGAMVELYNVTLVVPALDFLALLTVALDGTPRSVRRCMDEATLAHALVLDTRIRAAVPQVATYDCLVLAWFNAWGVNATALVVKPASALPPSLAPCFAQAPPPLTADVRIGGAGGAPAASPAASPEPESVSVGAVVGGVVGSVALLALLGLGAWVLRARRRRACAEASKLGAAPGGPPATTPPPAPHLGGPPAPPVASDSTSSISTVTASCSKAAPAGPGTQSTAAPARAAEGAVSPPPPPPAAEGSLLSLVASRERQLLADARAASFHLGSAVVIGGGGAAGTPPSGGVGVCSLAEAHDRLLAAALRGGGGGGQGVKGQRELEKGVQALASRLQGEGDGADTVTLHRELGRGSGGVVFQGTWRGLPVAVKTVLFETWEGGGQSEGEGEGEGEGAAQLGYVRAIMETAISASVGHPNVVATYHYAIKRMDDQHTQEGERADAALDVRMWPAPPDAAQVGTFKLFLVQELCTCSLRMALEHSALDPEAQDVKLALLHDVASALAYLHGRAIVHGDLTPGNILLKADRQTRMVVAKLADFGLSQRLGPQATHVSGVGAGTPFYVAPEVVLEKRLSPASDIYSFGVVAWQVFAQRAPYITLADGTPRPNPLFPAFLGGREPTAAVQNLIHRCFASPPMNRPTAHELVHGLQALREDPIYVL